MKKMINYVFVGLFAFLIVSPVFAINIASCESLLPNALIDKKISDIVSTIITIIKIAVPVLLVVFGSLDLVKGIIAGKEDEIKKGQSTFIKRLIAGALVFLVFVIVQFLLSLVASDENTNIMTCAKCFINGECTYKTNSGGTCPKGYALSNSVCVKK